MKKIKNFKIFSFFIVIGSILLTDGLNLWFKETFGSEYSISLLAGGLLLMIGFLYS